MQFPFETVGVRPPLDTGLRGLGEDLVVDVGDVRDDGDVEPLMGQPTAQHVEDHLFANVPEMRGGLHRQSTVVDRYLPGNQGNEILDGSGGCVVQAQIHLVKSSAARCSAAGDPKSRHPSRAEKHGDWRLIGTAWNDGEVRRVPVMWALPTVLEDRILRVSGIPLAR